MNKVLSSMVAVAFAGATFGAFAQPASKSTVEQSTTVQVPKADVKVDEKKSTTTTTTTKPAAKAESKSTTTTTTSERKADGDTKVEVKAKTKTETEKKY